MKRLMAAASASRCISSSRNRAVALLPWCSNHRRIGDNTAGRQHQQRTPGHGEDAARPRHEHERRQQNLVTGSR